MDFVNARRLKATVWSLKSANKILAISELCECQQAKSHSLVFGKFEQDISHIWTL